MRWVDRMGDEAAMAAFEALREQVRHDGRGGGGENGVGRGQTVELGENRALRFDTLGQALLNEVRAHRQDWRRGARAPPRLWDHRGAPARRGRSAPAPPGRAPARRYRA